MEGVMLVDQSQKVRRYRVWERLDVDDADEAINNPTMARRDAHLVLSVTARERQCAQPDEQYIRGADREVCTQFR